MPAFDPESVFAPGVGNNWRRAHLRADMSAFDALTWVFELGLPDPQEYPVDDLSRIADEVLRDDPGRSLGYGNFQAISFGDAGLRELWAERASARDGKAYDASNVMLTLGTMHGLQLAHAAFQGRGDVGGVEMPTYGNHGGRETITIPLDRDGMRVDILETELERLRQEGKRLTFFYTINDFHSPTGTTLSLPRRQKLLELASEHNFVIFQDAIYDAYLYDGERLPSFTSLDVEGRVIRADSFSKVVAPGLRLAVITAAPALIEAMALTRGDLGASPWTARIMEQYIREGLYDTHLDEACVLYRHKRDVVADALEAHCSPWATFDKPDGGFFIWVKLSEEVDLEQVAARTRAEGVAVRPGERFFEDEAEGKSFFRIAFTPVPTEQLEPGIEALGRAIKASLK